MGKLHDAWTKAKAKAKAQGVDTDGLFKLKLGEALDKFESAWDKLKPGLDAKHNAKTLTTAEYDSIAKAMEPLADKVCKTAFKYDEALLNAGKKFKEKNDKTNDQKAKGKIVAAVNEIKALIALLQMTIVPAVQEHCRLYLKKLKPKG